MLKAANHVAAGMSVTVKSTYKKVGIYMKISKLKDKMKKG